MAYSEAKHGAYIKTRLNDNNKGLPAAGIAAPVVWDVNNALGYGIGSAEYWTVYRRVDDGTVDLTVRLSSPAPVGGSEVEWDITEDTDGAQGVYFQTITEPAKTLSFAQGESEKTITITPINPGRWFKERWITVDITGGTNIRTDRPVTRAVAVCLFPAVSPPNISFIGITSSIGNDQVQNSGDYIDCSFQLSAACDEDVPLRVEVSGALKDAFSHDSAVISAGSTAVTNLRLTYDGTGSGGQTCTIRALYEPNTVDRTNEALWDPVTEAYNGPLNTIHTEENQTRTTRAHNNSNLYAIEQYGATHKQPGRPSTLQSGSITVLPKVEPYLKYVDQEETTPVKEGFFGDPIRTQRSPRMELGDRGHGGNGTGNKTYFTAAAHSVGDTVISVDTGTITINAGDYLRFGTSPETGGHYAIYKVQTGGSGTTNITLETPLRWPVANDLVIEINPQPDGLYYWRSEFDSQWCGGEEAFHKTRTQYMAGYCVSEWDNTGPDANKGWPFHRLGRRVRSRDRNHGVIFATSGRAGAPATGLTLWQTRWGNTVPASHRFTTDSGVNYWLYDVVRRGNGSLQGENATCHPLSLQRLHADNGKTRYQARGVQSNGATTITIDFGQASGTFDGETVWAGSEITFDDHVTVYTVQSTVEGIRGESIDVTLTGGLSQEVPDNTGMTIDIAPIASATYGDYGAVDLSVAGRDSQLYGIDAVANADMGVFLWFYDTVDPVATYSPFTADFPNGGQSGKENTTQDDCNYIHYPSWMGASDGTNLGYDTYQWHAEGRGTLAHSPWSHTSPDPIAVPRFPWPNDGAVHTPWGYALSSDTLEKTVTKI